MSAIRGVRSFQKVPAGRMGNVFRPNSRRRPVGTLPTEEERKRREVARAEAQKALGIEVK